MSETRSRDSIREAIPPAYTRWIGEQLKPIGPTSPHLID